MAVVCIEVTVLYYIQTCIKIDLRTCLPILGYLTEPRIDTLRNIGF